MQKLVSAIMTDMTRSQALPRFVVLFLLLIPLVFIGFSYWQDQRCQFDDITMCRIQKQIARAPETKLHGTYTEYVENQTVRDIEWALDGDTYELKLAYGDGETLHVIYTPEAIYLRDGKDGVWLSQKPDALVDPTSIFPFHPKEYLTSLTQKLSSPDVSFSLSDTAMCGLDSCQVYVFHDSSGQDISFSIDTTQKPVREIIEVIDGVKTRISFLFDDYQIPVPTDNAVPVSDDKHIFLEYFIGKKEKSKEEPKYLMDFETFNKDSLNLRTPQASFSGEIDVQ